jgi:NADH-quinone oxidoreductase subunit M
MGTLEPGPSGRRSSRLILLALGATTRRATVRWIALSAPSPAAGGPLPLYGQLEPATSAVAPVSSRDRLDLALQHPLPPGRGRHLVLVRAAHRLHHRDRGDLGWEAITERVNQYMGAFLILSGLMIGVFCALDGILFYTFFEATLIPMYLIIGVWGGPNKIYAAFKFFLYTLLGSLLMLVALVFLYTKSAAASTSPPGTSCRWAPRRRPSCSSPSSRPSR